MVGDVNYEAVKDKASYITPVPGGIGAITTTVLAYHLVKATGIKRASIILGETRRLIIYIQYLNV